MSAAFLVRAENGKQVECESRSEAEQRRDHIREQLDLDAEIIAPDGEEPTELSEPEVIEHSEPVDVDPEEYDLPDRDVGEDPLKWVPSDFVDNIDGSPAINRKGFEVLAHHYDVSVYSEVDVAPEETDFEFCRAKARAVRPNGQECEAFGSAHVDRGDDPEILLEMADTRARKRALSIATGMGVIAVEELKSEAQS